MKEKPITPYNRLLAEVREFVSKLSYRKRVTMFFYPKARLAHGWRLDDLYERAAAAEQLGYDVVLRADSDGLHVQYVQKVPESPYEWRE